MTDVDPNLSALRTYGAGPERTARVRAKCHAALAKRPSRRRIEPVMVLGASAVYLLTVIRTALLLYGF